MTREDVQRIFDAGRRVRELEYEKKLAAERKRHKLERALHREIQNLQREILERYDILL